MRTINLAAALAATCLTGFVGHARAAAACGSGYHADAGGACQPDVQEVNRYCPEGGVYHPAPNGGWTCETPAPASAGIPVYQPAPSSEPAAVYQPAPQYQPRPRHVVHVREPRHVVHRLTATASGHPVSQARAVGRAADALDRRAARHGRAANQRRRRWGGGGGGGWSDRRLKRDVVRLGASPSGLPIYAFQYVWGGPRYIGVMAQDLLKLRPDAVILDESGYYKVDYSRIDVEMREEPALANAL